MATYEKLTPAKFRSSLNEGKYDSATGARRAIGKASWTEEEKNKERNAVEKHFGGEKTPVAPKAAKVKGKPGPKPGAKAATKTVATPATKGKPGPKKGPRKSFVGKGNSFKGFSPISDFDAATRTIQVAASALTAMQAAKTADPDLDISEQQVAVNVMTAALSKLESLGYSLKSNPNSNGVSGHEPYSQLDGESEASLDA